LENYNDTCGRSGAKRHTTKVRNGGVPNAGILLSLNQTLEKPSLNKYFPQQTMTLNESEFIRLLFFADIARSGMIFEHS
jgi:hypothetical protein